MPRWTDLDAVDLSFFATAPQRFTYEVEIAAEADAVWTEFKAAPPLPWVRLLRGEYLSPPPFGVGTRRRVRLLRGAVALDEHFFHWDDAARRHSFYATAANLPVFKAFAEDYRVAAVGPNLSRFTWTFAFAPRRGFGLALAAGRPLNRLLFGAMLRDTRRHFATP